MSQEPPPQYILPPQSVPLIHVRPFIQNNNNNNNDAIERRGSSKEQRGDNITSQQERGEYNKQTSNSENIMSRSNSSKDNISDVNREDDGGVKVNHNSLKMVTGREKEGELCQSLNIVGQQLSGSNSQNSNDNNNSIEDEVHILGGDNYHPLIRIGDTGNPIGSMGYLNRNLEKEEKVVGEEDNGEYFV